MPVFFMHLCRIYVHKFGLFLDDFALFSAWEIVFNSIITYLH